MENGLSKSKWVSGLIIVAIAFSVNASQAGPRKIEVTHQSVPGELIVKLKDKKSVLSINALKSIKNILGSKSVLEAKAFKTDSQIFKIKLAKNVNLKQSIQKLIQDSSILYAEPNYIMKLFVDEPPTEFPQGPNDPDLTKTWGMQNMGQMDATGMEGKVGADIGVFPLWQKGFVGDKRVVVAVIDTGVQWDHPDLMQNIFTNTNDMESDGVDHDANGFINDIHGWNFFDNTNNSRDDHGHGTHVSGTIGGVGNNGIGVAGVVWNVTILPIKFLSGEGSGTLQGAIESINYARMMRAHIMSNSWGGGGFSQALYDAIAASRDAGIIFTAAAGNERNNNDSSPAFPASYDIANIISVAATDNRDRIANFSNYGLTKVHVAAPGVNVYSTVKDSVYDTYSGTSMATPHVSGVAAMLLSIFPNMAYAEVKQRLIQTSEPVPSLRRKVVAKGRVNAVNAVANMIPVTDEPNESEWITMDMSFESEHPYKSKVDQKMKVFVEGAKKIRVHFAFLDTEDGYDVVSLENEAGEVFDSYTGKQDNFYTDYLNGDTAYIHFVTDNTVNEDGFRIDRIQYIR
jgi:hypothetical protein